MWLNTPYFCQSISPFYPIVVHRLPYRMRGKGKHTCGMSMIVAL